MLHEHDRQSKQSRKTFGDSEGIDSESNARFVVGNSIARISNKESVAFTYIYTDTRCMTR